MKKSFIILSIILGILILVFVSNLFGLLSFLNYPINKVIAGNPVTSCNTDSDCELKYLDCSSCPKCGVINYDKWQPYCPFKRFEKECQTDSSCILQGSFIKCVDNQCKRVP
jgi:hypothetical protein